MTFIWSLLPRGFPWFSRPFIEHQVIIPIIVLVSWIAAISLVWRLQIGILCIYVILGVWIGIGLIIVILFPVFFLPGKLIAVGIGALVMTIGLVLFILFGWLRLLKSPVSNLVRDIAPWSGVCFGAVLPFVILLIARAGPAQTTPSGVFAKLEPLTGMTTRWDWEQDIPVGNASEAIQVSLNRRNKSIKIATQKFTLRIQPYMIFEGISPNRLWTVLGNWDTTYITIERVNTGKYKETDALYFSWSAKSLKSWVKPGDLSGETLIEQHRTEDSSVEVRMTTVTRLARQIDAHLSAYFDVEWYGQAPITLSIGHEQPYNWIPTQSDYPFGAPATFMTVMDDRVLLLKGSSAEKGPFKTLAEFSKKDPLFQVMVANRPVCQFILEGFVEQASQELSPTAGWGIPVNNILLEATQFTGDQPSGVWISFSLADTGVGRGFHAVGTGPGTYVSKLRVSIPLGL